jgi:hypothetical protein
MLESTSDSWADSRPEVGAEDLGVCSYCGSSVFKDEEWSTEYNQAVHLACQDWYYLNEGEDDER